MKKTSIKIYLNGLEYYTEIKNSVHTRIITFFNVSLSDMFKIKS